MTSGVFLTIPIGSITINRPERQRKKLEKIGELARSIRENGLINPPVVTPEYELVAGERRIEAMRSLGWLECPVQLTTDLAPIQLHLIELEENTKRVDLSWQDLNDAVAQYHRLRLQLDPSWNQAKTAEALGVDQSNVSGHLLVAEQRKKSPDVAGAEKMSTALGLARRKVERQRNVELREIAELAEPEKELRHADIITTSFLDWAPTYAGPLFNLIHCDFPYGVDTGDKSGQSAAKHLGSYADGKEVYFDLLQGMGATLDNFCAPEAHLIFWYSMKWHKETVAILEAMGWDVDPFPLIWLKSDNAGMLPDANRGPRRVYETALFASRGDRKIVRPVANAVALPTTKDFHTSEKPFDVLSHFFRMFVDETTRLLDPTCGSGMAVRAAEEGGASFALGLEMNEEFAERARVNCKL